MQNLKHRLSAVIVMGCLSQGAFSQSILEEVVVTAQRRVQSLQEVPISIEVVSGKEMSRQGFRDMSDLAVFSPTVFVDSEGSVNQNTAIRGFGTNPGGSLTVEQAVPIFVDGIHFGRVSQIRMAFLDVERLEVLKGPQPVFFGMNATAGALSIQTRKPTPEWEGNIDLGYGNHGNLVTKGGIGGPITDTLGIRVAGQYLSSTGYMRDVISGKRDIGAYDMAGGRVILEWKPTDNFKVTAKFEASSQSQDPEAIHICSVDGPAVFARQGPTFPGDEGAEQAVWFAPPKGEGWSNAFIPLGECYKNDLGRSSTGPHYEPPLYIRERNVDRGILDIRAASDAELKRQGLRGILGYEDIDSYNGYIDLAYNFENGVVINSQTSFSDYTREFLRENSFSPFAINNQSRIEDYNAWSSELRFTSATGGTLEWMLGLHWQRGYLDAETDNLRANVLTAQRHNSLWEDVEWKSAFATITFNFFDDRASIDLGGRYSKIQKDALITTSGASWIYDVFPCTSSAADDDGGGNFNPATCTRHPNAISVNPATDNPRIFDSSADLTNLWTMPFNVTRNTPSTWRSPRASAVGLTAFIPNSGRGPYRDVRNESEFDPQIVLRYRLNANHSLYGKWAQAFKAGGFDTGVTTLPPTQDRFTFGPERAETFELGSKGSLLDGRARYDLALFRVIFNELQLSTATPNLGDPRESLNAGEQVVDGIEFSTTFAVNEQFLVGFGGAILDGEMTDFPGAGCTRAEFLEAQGGVSNGCDVITQTIDRTGEKAPRTPDWKFVLDLDYWMPIYDQYRLTFNGKGYISDGYLLDPEGFTKTITMKKHGDINLSVGLGDMSDTWNFSVYARNLLEARPTYNSEFNPLSSGLIQDSLARSNFTTYGVQFVYSYK